MELPWFPCVQVVCHIPWKAHNKGYNFASDLISIEGLHTKLCASKVTRVLISRILGFPFGSLGPKWHLAIGPMTKHIKYYKGEGDGFPWI
jgi:hypothetical protein